MSLSEELAGEARLTDSRVRKQQDDAELSGSCVLKLAPELHQLGTSSHHLRRPGHRRNYLPAPLRRPCTRHLRREGVARRGATSTHDHQHGWALSTPTPYRRTGAAASIAPDIATAFRAHPRAVRYRGNGAYRAHPARGSRKLPHAPGNPRKSTSRKPCSREESPPIPSQPRSAMTGLSRRRSRVRVPSLPFFEAPANWHLALSR